MPQLNISSAESSGTGGIPTLTGTMFVAGQTDAGPPPSGPGYVKCQSLQDVVNAFGPRSAVSAKLLDWLEGYFNIGGQAGKVAYVARVTDNTAAAAALTLNDGLPAPKPTVKVTALTAGTEGNQTFVAVTAGTGATFTAGATATTVNLTAVSSYAGIGVGTPVSGTGVPAGTYIATVTPASGTATLSQAFTGTTGTVTFTPGTVTVTVIPQDSAGNALADEIHGPFYLTSQLFADVTSTWVTFTQSAAGGFTVNLPAAVAASALTGGADASDITDTSYVAALANFPTFLGSGGVALPGRTSIVCASGIQAHCNAMAATVGDSTERVGLIALADSTTAAGAISQIASLPAGNPIGDWTRCHIIQGSATLNALAGGTARTVDGTAVVAALRAAVALGDSQAIAPAGKKWPVGYITGFTTFFGVGGTFTQSDVNAMEAAGINCFANYYGTLCLFGYVTPETQDLVFDQFSAACERMAFSAELKPIMAGHEFDPIDTNTISQLDLQANTLAMAHYKAGSLFDGETGDASQAFSILTGSPVNTPATAQLRQLNVQANLRITRYADSVNAQITTFPVSVTLP